MKGALDPALHEAALGPIDRRRPHAHGRRDAPVDHASIGGEQHLGSLERAAPRRPARHDRLQVPALRWGQLHHVVHVHPPPLPSIPARRGALSGGRVEPQPRSDLQVHRRPRPVSRVHLCLCDDSPAGTGRSGSAAVLPRHCTVGAPHGDRTRAARPDPPRPTYRTQHRTARTARGAAYSARPRDGPINQNLCATVLACIGEQGEVPGDAMAFKRLAVRSRSAPLCHTLHSRDVTPLF
jgi:hypothetical protein